jgi:DNA-binding GntR family transcriptional regulator
MSAPRYRQLADTLIGDIGSGRYGVGTLLPPELQISAQYGVSRHTAREAIRRLVDMGLISRRQGIGTRVTAKNAQSRFIASLTSISDLFQYTQRTRLKLLGERSLTADAGLAALLRCKPGQRWVRFETCRYSIGAATPISHTEIFVLPAHSRIRDRLEGAGVWVYGLIEQCSGERIVELQQDVGAVAIPARIARLMHSKPRAPGLHVLRYYYGARDRLLSVSVNLYPENRFRFSTRWRLEWGVDKPYGGP